MVTLVIINTDERKRQMLDLTTSLAISYFFEFFLLFSSLMKELNERVALFFNIMTEIPMLINKIIIKNSKTFSPNIVI